MEYYKRLAKNYPLSLVVNIVFGILTLALAIYGVYIIANALSQPSFIIIFKGVCLAFLGSAFSYLLLYFNIVTHPYAQIKEDFIVESEGENIHIRYKDYDIVQSRELFGHKAMKDTNGNKISTNDRERIWKVVYYFYREKLERNTEEKVVVKNNEVNDSFQATKLATDEEKRTYISRKKYDKNPFFLPSLLLILLMPFGLIYLGVHSNDVGKLEQSSPLASNVYFVTMCILIMLFFACDYFIIKKIVNKSLIKKIMKNNLYITECKIWDKKYCYRNTSDGDYVTEYFVKIADGENVNDDWIEVSKKTYETIDTELFNKAVLYTIGDGKKAKRDILPRE